VCVCSQIALEWTVQRIQQPDHLHVIFACLGFEERLRGLEPEVDYNINTEEQ
jgi:hypothetical protein